MKSRNGLPLTKAEQQAYDEGFEKQHARHVELVTILEGAGRMDLFTAYARSSEALISIAAKHPPSSKRTTVRSDLASKGWDAAVAKLESPLGARTTISAEQYALERMPHVVERPE